MGAGSSQPAATDTTFDSRVATLEAWQKTDNMYISNVSDRQFSLQTTVTAQTGRVNTLATNVDDISSRNFTFGTLFAAYDSNYAVLSDRVSTVSDNVNFLSNAILGAGQISARLSDVTGLVKLYDRTNMLASITNIDGLVADARTRIGTVSGNVWTLSQNMGSNTNSWNSISTRVSNLNVSYSGLEAKFNTLGTNITGVSSRLSTVVLSGSSYAFATNQAIVDQKYQVDLSVGALSTLISMNNQAAMAAVLAVSTIMSNTIMALSDYVKVLDGKVTMATATSPKIYLAPPAGTSGTGQIIDSSIPSGSIVYSQNVKNVQIYNAGFSPGYTIYVVNYSTSALEIVTSYSISVVTTITTGPTYLIGQNQIFYQGPNKTKSATVTIGAGKVATFVWTGDMTNGPWVVTFT